MGLRFTKAEREMIRDRMQAFIDDKPVREAWKRTCERIIEKLELAELPVKKGTYLTVPDAISAFKEVLGPRLLAPRYEAVGVLAQMKKRIQALGLTRADCVSIAKVAGAEWQGVIRAESLVRQADKLMAGSQLEMGSKSTPQTARTTPVDLGEEDI